MRRTFIIRSYLFYFMVKKTWSENFLVILFWGFKQTCLYCFIYACSLEFAKLNICIMFFLLSLKRRKHSSVKFKKLREKKNAIYSIFEIFGNEHRYKTKIQIRCFG